MLRREPVTMETQSGWREAFAPATRSRISGWREAFVPATRSRIWDKSLEEEQVQRVDERLARVARIVVEQYDGDVKAFVESVRYRTEMNRKAEVASDHGDEAALA
jgi:hypothetical protein